MSKTGRDKTPASSKKRARTTVAPRVVWAPRAPTHEEIARRAFRLWERRGRVHGYHLEDWITAENELMTGFVLGPR
jgi:hypothetical protein